MYLNKSGFGVYVCLEKPRLKYGLLEYSYQNSEGCLISLITNISSLFSMITDYFWLRAGPILEPLYEELTKGKAFLSIISKLFLI
ncbi:MAG: hypothetical protein COA58_02550 [Bacteroidetes bacterium]|nr:MAG: hypothetical protein COA58_02550 [Bacteroidota bacterium]